MPGINGQKQRSFLIVKAIRDTVTCLLFISCTFIYNQITALTLTRNIALRDVWLITGLITRALNVEGVLLSRLNEYFHLGW